MHCRTFNRISGIEASSTLPSHGNNNCLQTLPNTLWGQNPWLRPTNLEDVDQLTFNPRNIPNHKYLRLQIQTSTKDVREVLPQTSVRTTTWYHLYCPSSGLFAKLDACAFQVNLFKICPRI